MTDFCRGMITLIKCAVTGQAEPLPAGFSMEEAAAFARKQDLVTLVYTGALLCGIPREQPEMRELFRQYVRLQLHSEGQMEAVQQLLATLEANGIDYLPLKGVNMKQLYPGPELRYMGDADILIRQEQYDRIIPLMQTLGFDTLPEYDHNYPWQSSALQVELHKRLMPDASHPFDAYWENGWQRAKPEGGFCHTFRAEDHFLFQFTHFAHHYRDGGIGCRYLLDLWVYRRAFPNMDESYLTAELAKLQLLTFYRNVSKTLAVWFDGAPSEEKTEAITEYVFSGGSWGTWDNYALSAALRSSEAGQGNRLTLLRKKIFPSLKEMGWYYPVLKKVPVFLPVFWVVRMFDALLFHREMVGKARRILQVADSKSMEDYCQAMQFVGLDITNGRKCPQ